MVKKELELKKSPTVTDVTSREEKTNSLSPSQSDVMNSAYQELYELTQRKFLKEIIEYCNKIPSTSREYPRLFCIDFVSCDHVPTFSGESTPTQQEDKDKSTLNISSHVPCIRALCEHEEGWHLSESLIILPDAHMNETTPYLVRIMNILKCGNLFSEMQVFQIEKGQKLIAQMEEMVHSIFNNSSADIMANNHLLASYTFLRNYFIQKMVEEKTLIVSGKFNDEIDLKRCELKNGKILWLCEKHIDMTKARLLKDTEFSIQNVNSDYEKMLDFVDQTDVNLIV
jgi:hypothetical protein